MNYITMGTLMYPGHPHYMKYHTDEFAGNEETREPCYRLLLIHEGRGILSVNGTAYPCLSPSVYCLNEKDHIELMEACGIRASSLHFHPIVINQNLSLDKVNNGTDDFNITDVQDRWVLKPFFERSEGYYGCIPTDPSVSMQFARLLKSIQETLTSQPASWPCISRSYLIELLFIIRRLHDKKEAVLDSITLTLPESLQAVVKHLYLHYPQKITLEELTTAFHTNKTTLNSEFRTHTGYSVMSYVNLIRMKAAESLLKNTCLTVQDIADRSGFKDITHFARHFKRYAGCSPNEYRRL